MMQATEFERRPTVDPNGGRSVAVEVQVFFSCETDTATRLRSKPAANRAWAGWGCRTIQLRCGRAATSNWHPRMLLRKGCGSSDQILQIDHVVHVEATEARATLIGSVKHTAIFETEANETIGDLAWPIEQQNKRVQIEDAVTRPDEHMLRPGSTTSTSVPSGRLVERLRSLKPPGHIVRQVTSLSDVLPETVRRDGVRLSIPTRPATASAFGRLFSTRRHLRCFSRTVGDHQRLTGAPTRDANGNRMLAIRANGLVSSGLKGGGVYSRSNQIAGVVTKPGDMIFASEDPSEATWVQRARNWTQIHYQLGIGIAGTKSTVN